MALFHVRAALQLAEPLPNLLMGRGGVDVAQGGV